MSPRIHFVGLAVFAAVGLSVPGLARAEEPKGKPPVCVALYHRDHDHLWNRVHAALFIRSGPDGKDYGLDRLEPLLWEDSDRLLSGKSADRAAAVLDEFLRDKGESLIEDPLKHAVLQRDLWLVANWAAGSSSDESKRLLERLARVIRRLAPTSDQVAKLPDNYAQAVASKRFADRFDLGRPDRAYLPPDLFRADGPWVCVGRVDGPTAPGHLQESGGNRFTNSAFLVFLKLPAGRDATLDFLKRLAAFDKPPYLPNTDAQTKRAFPSLPNPGLPQWPKGTEVALVRRALLIDSSGNVVPSPITESVQLRAMRVDTPVLTGKTLAELERSLPGDVVNGYGPDMPVEQRARIGRAAPDAQAFAEFRLRRVALFAGEAGGLYDATGERDVKTGFNAHSRDQFADRERPAGMAAPFPERVIGATCIGCHRFPGVYGFNSFHESFPFAIREKSSRGDDEGYVPKSHALTAITVDKVEQAAVRWKEGRPGRKALKKLLPE